MRGKLQLPLVLVLVLATSVEASQDSVGPNGINSAITGLDGSNILIGQYEAFRSAKVNYDDSDDDPMGNPAITAPNTDPFNVRFGTSAAIDPPDSGHSNEHATFVAQVMIGSAQPDPAIVGVAPNARLHSLAIAPTALQDHAIAIDALAGLTLPKSDTVNGRIQALNMSFGIGLTPFVEFTNGNSFFTQFVDWSAQFHNLLNVVAWPNFNVADPLSPSDNFNGITVAASGTSGPSQIYRKFDVANHDVGGGFDADGTRTSIDLLAPGSNLELLNIGEQPMTTLLNGTSFATPHVTGAAALLHQHIDSEVANSNPRFHSNRSRRHEVVKAVLLNSADKLVGVHGSNRTIEDFDSVNWDWTKSAAFNNPNIPLDIEVGAGHLNVNRALEQLKPGEYDPGMVPLIGWDFGNTGGQGDLLEYVFDQPLTGGEYIAITLAWDREIEKNNPGDFDAGDIFLLKPLNKTLSDLNIYLMPKDETDLSMAVAESTSSEMNLEHIFFKDFPTGEYKIVLEHKFDFTGLDQEQDFALAWWFGDLAEPLPGDFDSDGDVDTDDYSKWKMDFGMAVAAGTGSDGNGDGVVNIADYTIWRDNLGATAAAAIDTQQVPEPTAFGLMVISVSYFATRRVVR